MTISFPAPIAPFPKLFDFRDSLLSLSLNSFSYAPCVSSLFFSISPHPSTSLFSVSRTFLLSSLLFFSLSLSHLSPTLSLLLTLLYLALPFSLTPFPASTLIALPSLVLPFWLSQFSIFYIYSFIRPSFLSFYSTLLPFPLTYFASFSHSDL